jgi:hypothetical protein
MIADDWRLVPGAPEPVIGVPADRDFLRPHVDAGVLTHLDTRVAISALTFHVEHRACKNSATDARAA